LRASTAIYALVLLFFLILILAITPVPGVAQSSGNKAYGEYLSNECVTCHQLSGNSPGIPTIVGLPEASIILSLQEYRDKKRINEVMQNIASRLGDKEIAALAAYFGSLPKQ
jgi:cytochrome c553